MTPRECSHATMVMVRTLFSELVKPSISPPSIPDYCSVIRSSNLDLIILNTYIKTVYFYNPSKERSSDFFSTDVLTDSLRQALSHYYPMAGRLIRKGERSIEIACNGAGALFVRACTDCSVEELKGFEPKEEFLQLVPSLESFQEESSRPLFIVQVTTFTCGGVSLGLGVEHHVADGMSAIAFLNSWSALARGKPIESKPCFDRVWLKARSPPTPHYAHDEYVSLPRPKQYSNGLNTVTSPPAIRMFEISKEFVHEMKQRFARSDIKPFSTYELLAAHVWRSVCKARQLPSDEKSMLITLLDGRSRLRHPPLPNHYFGNVIFTCCPTDTAGELTSSFMNTVKKVRQDLRRVDDAYCRSAIDFLELQPDLSRFVKGAHTFASPNLGLISWTQLPMYECDFGWGKPIHVGPAFMPWEGHAYLLASPEGDGSFRLFISLKSEHMQKFSDLILQLKV